MAQSLAAGRGFQVAPSLPAVDVPTVPGKDGRRYSKYGLGEPVLLLPAAFAGGRNQPLVERLAAYEQAVFAALAVLFLFLLAGAAGVGETAATALALLFAFGSPQLAYAHDQFDVTASGAALLAAVWLWLRGSVLGAGAAAGMALLIRTGNLAAIAPLAVWIGVVAPKRLPSFLAPVVLAAGVIAGYDFLRFGSIFETGYTLAPDSGRFTAPWMGAAGLLVSPGKGLLWYCPAVVLAAIGYPALFRRKPELAIFIAAELLANLLFYGAYQFWPGDWSWGPRYLLPVLGLVLLPAAELRRRVAPALLGAAGFAVNLLDVLVDFRNVIASALISGHDIYAPGSYWMPAESEIWRHLVALAQLASGHGVYPAIYRQVDLQLGIPPTAWWDTWWLIDLWWGRWTAAAAVAALVAVAVECARRVGRLARSEKI